MEDNKSNANTNDQILDTKNIEKENTNSSIIDILENELYEKNLIKGKIDRDILNKVDVVGFDLDHTLVIYKIEQLTELMYNGFARYLVDHKNYPREILIYTSNDESSDSNCNLDEKENNKKFNTEFVHRFSGIEIVLDLKNGNALKIDENRIVKKAYHGIDELTQEQIENIYGTEKEFTEIHIDNAKGNNYHSILSNFEYHAIPIFLMCVHLLEIGTFKMTESEPYKKIFEDILEAAVFNYNLYDAENKRVMNMSESKGYFFHEFEKNPKKYLLDYSPKELLIHLRNKGVQVFFATNSFYEFADLIMRNTIGDDYLDYFDLAIYYSQKPSFFYSDNKAKAYFPDLSKKDHKGDAITEENLKEEKNFERLKKEKTLIEGSYHVVEEFFRQKKENKDLKFIYVGDNLYADVYHSSSLPNWSSIGVLDEINTGFLGNTPQDFKKIWKMEEKVLGIEAQEPKMNSFFTKISREKFLFAVSNVDTLKYLN
jgi:hypothetical protein